MAAAHITEPSLLFPSITSALSAMQDKLPEALRVKDPCTWTMQDVSVWVASWGPPFTSAAEKVLENGIDGGTLHQVLNVESQQLSAARSSLRGDCVVRVTRPW